MHNICEVKTKKLEFLPDEVNRFPISLCVLHFNALNQELGVVILFLGSQNPSDEGLSHKTSYTLNN